MQQAAAYFIGEHDFRNFCKMDLEHVKSFRRTMLDFQVVSILPAGADGRALYALYVKGTAFLWHQVGIFHRPQTAVCLSPSSCVRPHPGSVGCLLSVRAERRMTVGALHGCCAAHGWQAAGAARHCPEAARH